MMTHWEKKLEFEILEQPNLVTCGPTSLHAVYRYHGETMGLTKVIDEVRMLEGGGTLAVLLGIDALKRGYSATIYTYNLQVWDPSWFANDEVDIPEKLRLQMEVKQHDRRLITASEAYLEYLALGGQVRYEELRPRLITRYLSQEIPILTGLSATYLYRESREMPDCTLDDLRGTPAGHFVVLCGYDKDVRSVLVADPLYPNPFGPTQYYPVSIERVICSILLGILTYDGNMLIIRPHKEKRG